MNKLHDLRDMLMRELDECSQKGEISPNSLDVIDKLTHSVKSIDTILAMEEYGDYGEYNARRRDSRGRYMDGYNAGYNRNYSRDQYGEYGNDYGRDYNRGYNRSYNRDEYGRDQYGNDYSRRRYSRDEAQRELMDNLRDMEMSAASEEQKKMIRKWISQAEQDN